MTADLPLLVIQTPPGVPTRLVTVYSPTYGRCKALLTAEQVATIEARGPSRPTKCIEEHGK